MQKRLTRLLSGLAITLAVSLSASFTGYAATLVTDVTGYTLNSQGEMVTFNKILFPLTTVKGGITCRTLDPFKTLNP